MRISSPKDLVGAVLTFAAGIFFVLHGFSYPLGSAARMGAGFFPVILGFVAIGLSFLMFIRSLIVHDHMEPVAWRPFAAVIAALGVFGLALPALGLGPAIALTALTASFADRHSKLWQTGLLAVVLAVATWAIFLEGLGLVIPFYRSPV